MFYEFRNLQAHSELLSSRNSIYMQVPRFLRNFTRHVLSTQGAVLRKIVVHNCWHVLCRATKSIWKLTVLVGCKISDVTWWTFDYISLSLFHCYVVRSVCWWLRSSQRQRLRRISQPLSMNRSQNQSTADSHTKSIYWLQQSYLSFEASATSSSSNRSSSNRCRMTRSVKAMTTTGH